MARHITATTEITIDAPLDRVWTVMAEDFAGIGKWSSGVKRSTGSGPSMNGSACTERACEIAAMGFSDTKERIVEFTPRDRIRYELYDGLPGFVIQAINGWHFEAVEGGARVRGQTDMDVKGPIGLMMGGFMKKNLTRVLGEMAEEAKHYIETGQVHPRKAKLNAKQARKGKAAPA